MNASRISLATATLATVGLAATAVAQDWTAQAIAPVTNPIFFESPLAQTEVRPIFIHHRLDSGFVGGGSVNVYALQLRYAVNDRLAIIATKDGFIETDTPALGNRDGWGDLAAGVKYSIYRDDAKQAVITPGVTVSLPTGSMEVFQGDGSGVVNAFVSATKGWDNLHLTGNIGVQLPFDGDKDNSNLHYSVMLDYYTCKWFIPFVAFNAFTTLSDGNGLGITTEGFDLINFGSSAASGTTQGAIGFGFRSRLLDNLDLGFAYEVGVIEDGADIFKDRVTVDVAWRF
jgi:hypothetical protein